MREERLGALIDFSVIRWRYSVPISTTEDEAESARRFDPRVKPVLFFQQSLMKNPETHEFLYGAKYFVWERLEEACGASASYTQMEYSW